MTEKHPLGWECPDCNTQLDPEYTDASKGALAVCPHCLALMVTEGGEVKLMDYHSMSVTDRCMFIQGVTMMLTHVAMDVMEAKAEEASRH